eukprot:scaffold22568_cov66-Phaeocystis_antarctica.AAC.1
METGCWLLEICPWKQVCWLQQALGECQPRAREGLAGCKADHPLAAGVAGRGHGVAAARKDGTLAVLGVRCAAVHVELKVSAACECGALHCAR